jgi:serine acetyltransferase
MSVQSPVIIETQVTPLPAEAYLPFWSNLKADLVAHVIPENRGMSQLKWFLTSLTIILFSSGFHLIFLYRLSRLCRFQMGWVGRLISALILFFERHWYYSTFSPYARIEGGVILPHPQGIIIGAGVSIGARIWIFQNVTIGGAPNKVGLPQIGADSRIYTGAVLAGPITVGHNSTIGANSVISVNIGSNTLVKAARPEVIQRSVKYDEI